MFFKLDQETKCVLFLCTTFVIYGASTTTLDRIKKTIVSSVEDDRPGFSVDGYTMSAISFGTFTLGLVLVGPYVINVLGPRASMFIAAVFMGVYVAGFLVEIQWFYYLITVLCGLCESCMWPSQGRYLLENSSPENMNRNCSIFWFMYSSSKCLGNTVIYFVFRGKQYLDETTRHTAIYCLLAIDILALVFFFCLPRSTSSQRQNVIDPVAMVKKMYRILLTRRMLWLIITFCYAGLQQTLESVHGSSVGFTLAFGNSAKEMVPLSGVFNGLGGTIGGLVLCIFSEKVNKHRRLTVVVGCLCGVVAFFISFMNLSDEAAFGNTYNIGFINPPSASLSLIAAFLISAADIILTVQLYTLIGIHYPSCTAEALALYKSIKNTFVSGSFFSSSHLGLHYQLLIAGLMSAVGLAGYVLADSQPADVIIPHVTS